MTTTAKKAEVILGSDNYFHWEFAMRMTLARKGLLAHVQVVKEPAEVTEAWMLNDMKALGLIAQGVDLKHTRSFGQQRLPCRAGPRCASFTTGSTMHNRVMMTRRLYEFKMEEGSTMAQHLDRFDELIGGLQTLSEPLDESRQFVILISSLPHTDTNDPRSSTALYKPMIAPQIQIRINVLLKQGDDKMCINEGDSCV
ncbi:hypothetical protein F443_06911 [Phytophthora nicotianae P1569]|nr:hypothetical protein F443_06911 [Phytophthora nicotianae P1569]